MVKLFIGSNVLCVFSFEICTQRGEGEKREGMQNKTHGTFDTGNAFDSVIISESLESTTDPNKNITV